jgi:hypothetical protein
MLIFDGFKTRKDADAFTRHVGVAFSLAGNVYDDQDDSDRVDPIHLALIPPIALVERCDDEEPVIAAVEEFGGVFVGS